jgi:diaminohydroxyphosphoribosylaminopyrimidine deaminase/5-amino-6-(5-phosphoribosylamino)uracil reductase
MRNDEKYMLLAVALARKAEGLTSPNPAVGAVIVKGGRIVGTGYHKRCGLPHAEVCALKAAGGSARGATLYVTLEPCDHFGRTPPCTEAIIKSGIRRVVIAARDPNPITEGRGIKKLNSKGVRTSLGILEKEAVSLNKPFTKFITKKMPYVTLKLAESIDGKIATRTGDSRWITSDDAREYVQRLRLKSDAVMVGVNTVIADDPTLLPRIRRKSSKRNIRVVVDTGLKTPLNSRLLSSARSGPVLIATTRKVSGKKAAACVSKGAAVLFAKRKNGRVDLRDMFKSLARMDIMEVLVEGGGELAAALIEEKLVDKFIFFIAPKIIGGRGAVTSVEGSGAARMKDAVELKNVSVRKFSKDFMIEAEPA